MKRSELINDVVKAPLHFLFQKYFDLRASLRFASGVNRLERKQPVYISLTSYPKRFSKLHLCIESLLSQSYKPDGIILWTDQPMEKIPAKLTRLCKFGLELRKEPDVGPFGKIVFALNQLPEAILVTADDDNIYPGNWLNDLMASYEEFPSAIHCHRAHGITVDSAGRIEPYDKWNYGAVGMGSEPNLYLMPTGVSGVLYPPHCLHDDVTNIAKFKELCPSNDDVWLKVMSLLKGTKCRLLGGKSKDFYIIPSTQVQALWHENEFGKTKKQVDALLESYHLRNFFGTNLERISVTKS